MLPGFQPRQGCPRDEDHSQRGDLSIQTKAASLQLSATLPLEKKGSGAIADFTLTEGQTVTFALGGTASESLDNTNLLTEPEADEFFRTTVDYWRRWLAQSSYRGRWREMVEHSALTLKLLTYETTGTIVAAPPAACRRSWEASVIGTTVTPGSATPPSPSTPFSASDSPMKRPGSWAGSKTAPRT